MKYLLILLLVPVIGYSQHINSWLSDSAVRSRELSSKRKKIIDQITETLRQDSTVRIELIRKRSAQDTRPSDIQYSFRKIDSGFKFKCGYDVYADGRIGIRGDTVEVIKMLISQIDKIPETIGLQVGYFRKGKIIHKENYHSFVRESGNNLRFTIKGKSVKVDSVVYRVIKNKYK